MKDPATATDAPLTMEQLSNDLAGSADLPLLGSLDHTRRVELLRSFMAANVEQLEEYLEEAAA